MFRTLLAFLFALCVADVAHARGAPGAHYGIDQPANSAGQTAGGAGAVKNYGFVPDNATITLVAAITTPPTAARQVLQNNVIWNVKAGNIWPKLDVLQVTAGADSQAARLNWKAPATYTATATGTPTFVADRGYTATSAANYLDSNFNPSTAVAANYVRDFASLFVWNLTQGQDSNILFGWYNGSNGANIIPRSLADNFAFRANNTGGITAPNTDGRGLFIGVRTGSGASALVAYRNGVSLSLTGTSASTAPVNANFHYGNGAASVFNAGQAAAGGAGAAFNAGEAAGLYTALSPYMFGVGAQ